ncbi:MAG: flotillin-like protein FloA [Planctomycetaceae bacterium]
MMATWLLIVAAVILGVSLLVVGRYFSLWLRAYVTGTRIGVLSLMLMSLRKVDPRIIVQCKIMAVQAGLPDFPTNAIEAQFLAGGNVQRVTLALIAAHRAGIDLDWNTAAAIDLAGRDILDAVQVSVNPKVINCPDPTAGRGETLDGVAKDGIQLKVRVRVTVRTNLSQLIGGATESTVIARVGQGIVTAIGSCNSYRDALADPQVITRQVIEKGLDAQTAFAIVSIDIADIDVGENVGAVLQMAQADADIRIARAHAEQRRAMAVAREQEMVALTREHQAAVVLAEARIPHALAEAYRGGNLRQPGRKVSSQHEVSLDFPRIRSSIPPTASRAEIRRSGPLNKDLMNKDLKPSSG